MFYFVDDRSMESCARSTLTLHSKPSTLNSELSIQSTRGFLKLRKHRPPNLRAEVFLYPRYPCISNGPTVVFGAEAALYERGNPAHYFSFLFLEPCLDTLRLRSDVISSIKILPLGRVRILAHEMSLDCFFLPRLYPPQVTSRLIRPSAGPCDQPRTFSGSNLTPWPLEGTRPLT